MEHACDLAERIGDLLFDDRSADMIFIVEGERLPAHRAILSTSCGYFRALLQGNMKESLQNEIVLLEVPLRGFKLVMSYIYTGQMRLGELDDDTLLEVLEIAHMYGFAKLEASLRKYLQRNLTLKNVFKIYSKTLSLKLEDLGEACYHLMIENPNATLEAEAFCDLSEAALCDVLSRDTFCAEEIEIFKAVLKWRVKCQPDQDFANVIESIRLPLIDTKNLVTTVKNSGLVSIDHLVDAIEANECHAANRNFRGTLRNDVNLATPDFGALKLMAKPRGEYAASRTCPDYDSEDMPPYHSELSFPAATGFTVALSKPFFINHIGLEFCDRSFECSYYVEVSVNLVDWVRVIDHSEYCCRSIQDLYFERRVVRYIRLIGTWTNSEKNVVKFTKLEVNHTTKKFKLDCGFYAPEENVSCPTRGATLVIKSLDDFEALIHSDTEDDSEASTHSDAEDDEDEFQWTSHGIGNGSIMIQLPQPYTVNSMRMLLRSDESRAYLYYVETSIDKENWTRVTDRTTDLCRSWQNITFRARPVLYINIVGTASTVDELFSCAHFECPAPLQDLDKCQTQENGTGSGVAEHD